MNFTCSMLHFGDKRKPFNHFFDDYWPVLFVIMTINFLFIWIFIHLSINFISNTAASQLSFHFSTNSGWLISSNNGPTYVNKYFNYTLLFIIIYGLNITLMKIWWYPQLLEGVWYGVNFCSINHNMVLIMHIHCMNYLFFIIRNYW